MFYRILFKIVNNYYILNINYNKNYIIYYYIINIKYYKIFIIFYIF